jgi:hypothetical protein
MKILNTKLSSTVALVAAVFALYNLPAQANGELLQHADMMSQSSMNEVKAPGESPLKELNLLAEQKAVEVVKNEAPVLDVAKLEVAKAEVVNLESVINHLKTGAGHLYVASVSAKAVIEKALEVYATGNFSSLIKVAPEMFKNTKDFVSNAILGVKEIATGLTQFYDIAMPVLTSAFTKVKNFFAGAEAAAAA